MTDNELRTKVERLRTITDAAWQYLIEYDFVAEALDKSFEKDQIAHIIKAIDVFKAMWGYGKSSEDGIAGHSEGGAGAQASSGPFAVRLQEVERERALLLTEAQVRAANTDQRVKEFRGRHLPDGLLSDEGAEAFLDSTEAHRLTSLATYLARYYGWHQEGAAWWVLTGEIPSVRPVRVSFRESQTLDAPSVYLINIEAPPWVSPATFQGAFVDMRRRMDAEGRPPEARSVRVVRFVDGLRNGPTGEKLTFEELCRRWNENHPDEAFAKSRTFEKAYERTAKILRRQYNTEIEREVTPELRRQRARLKKVDARLKAAHEDNLEWMAEHRPDLLGSH
jgi:hypothetical protein